ncbi:hypothetical protein ES703_19714 [subsurface metagenome]
MLTQPPEGEQKFEELRDIVQRQEDRGGTNILLLEIKTRADRIEDRNR